MMIDDDDDDDDARGKCLIDDYSRYLALLLPSIVDRTLGTLQVLVHIVTVNR